MPNPYALQNLVRRLELRRRVYVSSEVAGYTWHAFGSTADEAKHNLVARFESAAAHPDTGLWKPYEGEGVEAFGDYFGFCVLVLPDDVDAPVFYGDSLIDEVEA